jgi:glutathionylspermidine synthase
MVENNHIIEHNRGNYGAEGYVYQALFKLPNFDGNHAVIGSWVVGQEAVGIGIRESNDLISNDSSRFVPHLITSFVE